MPDIDLGALSDRDLLVSVVTKVNAMDEKIDVFCRKVEEVTVAHNRLQVEHNMRITQGADCINSNGFVRGGSSKKSMAASGGIGGVIGGALAVLIERLFKTGG